MYTRRLVYQHGISRQLLKRMSDEKYKVADAWSLDDANRSSKLGSWNR